MGWTPEQATAPPAHGLDEVEVGIAVDALLTDEHTISSRQVSELVKGASRRI